MILVRVGFVVATVLFLIIALGCPPREPTPPPPGQEPPPELIEIIGTVHFVELEGGFWGVTDDDGNNYEVVDFPEDLKAENLRVKFQFEIVKDYVSIYMWGPGVKMVDSDILD